MSVVLQLIPNQSNRRSMVQWYFPLLYSLYEHFYGADHFAQIFTLNCWNWKICGEFWCFSWYWWSFMIKLYLSLMFKSVIDEKSSHFNLKWGGKVNLTESIWMTREKIWTMWTKFFARDSPFNPTFSRKLVWKYEQNGQPSVL